MLWNSSPGFSGEEDFVTKRLRRKETWKGTNATGGEVKYLSVHKNTHRNDSGGGQMSTQDECES